jgi:hypothetical protein
MAELNCETSEANWISLGMAALMLEHTASIVRSEISQNVTLVEFRERALGG